jgi:hypothetical protein
VTLVNSGLIDGNIAIFGGNDKVTNSGTITGAVDLGDGKNSLVSNTRLAGSMSSAGDWRRHDYAQAGYRADRSTRATATTGSRFPPAASQAFKPVRATTP